MKPVNVPQGTWDVVYVPKHPEQVRRERDRARDLCAAFESRITQAVDILERHDPACPGEAIQRALAVLDPGA